mmetsp:Transcript_35661/g.119193  ORF Transcript_35661/g.119193 Transcript_35661/m.119193 type:complete len:214 (-) Transcript_35661:223-864(-)
MSPSLCSLRRAGTRSCSTCPATAPSMSAHAAKAAHTGLRARPCTSTFGSPPCRRAPPRRRGRRCTGSMRTRPATRLRCVRRRWGSGSRAIGTSLQASRSASRRSTQRCRPRCGRRCSSSTIRTSGTTATSPPTRPATRPRARSLTASARPSTRLSCFRFGPRSSARRQSTRRCSSVAASSIRTSEGVLSTRRSQSAAATCGKHCSSRATLTRA